MWLDSPGTLRQQILDDFHQHRTPTGCVRRYPLQSERRDAAESDEAGRELREDVAGFDDGRPKA